MSTINQNLTSVTDRVILTNRRKRKLGRPGYTKYLVYNLGKIPVELKDVTLYEGMIKFTTEFPVVKATSSGASVTVTSYCKKAKGK